MTNIEKMYELAGVSNIDYKLHDYFEGTTLKTKIEFIEKCNFTAKKQLKLIKWLATNWGSFALYRNKDGFLCACHSFSSCFCETEKQALSGLVCELWKDLTEAQREEIRGILR